MLSGAPTDHRREPHHPTWRSRRAWAVLLGVLVLGTALDLWSKELAFRRVALAPVTVHRDDVLRATGRLQDLVPPHPPRVVLDNLLHFTLVLNPGAVFGIGAGRRWFFVAFTLVALVFGVALFARWTRPRDRAAHAALGLVLAGGLGNLYDRLRYGCVRDFIHPLPGMRLPFAWTWPGGGHDLWPYVSNLADLFLIIGVVMLVGYSMLAHRGEPERGRDVAAT